MSVSVQISEMFVCCCVLSVQPLLSLLVGYSSGVGNVQELGFILRECGLGPLRNLRGCVCGLVCARPYSEG